MNNFYYCHICGEILERKDVHRLVERNLTTTKRQTLYHVCGHCLHNLRNRRFKMIRQTNLKGIEWHRIFVEPLIKGKSETLYDVLPEHLEKIQSLEVDKGKLVLKSKDRKRIWTVFNIRDLIEHNDEEMLKILMKLYEYQTDDEKTERKTKWQNAVGFNQADAGFLTGMAKLYATKHTLTERQLYGTRKRLLKYAQQITIILNA